MAYRKVEREVVPGPPERSGGGAAARAMAGTTVPDFRIPATEVVEKPKRRRFTAEYKLRILKQADACVHPGELGALLRREGLYSSSLGAWRLSLPQMPSDSRSAALTQPRPALKTALWYQIGWRRDRME
jgi:hypothetical protein